MVVNEILPVPANIDWNNDGEVNARDQWIEIANLSESPIDLGGWSLDNNGTGHFAIPIGTVLQPRQIVVFYGSQTGLNLSDGVDQVRIKEAGGRVIDRVKYEPLPGDASFSRDAAGGWHSDWPPSPGAPNAQPGNAVAQAKAAFAAQPDTVVRALLDRAFAAFWQMLFALFP